MADLHPVAKRIHNASPAPVRLTLDDGTNGVFEMSSTEFFQQEFRAEGTRRDDEGAEYRLITSEDHESIHLGRKGPADDGWSMVGEVVAAEAAD
ncbi:transcriptional regulator [Haloferacaceae archaeon DSL9]